MYGNHRADDILFDFKGKPFNVIAVDPGRVDLIHAVRLHQTQQALGKLESCLAPILPTDDNTSTGKASRRRAKHRFLNKEHKSVFKLTNKQWRHDSGQLLHVKKTKKLLPTRHGPNTDGRSLRSTDADQAHQSVEVRSIHERTACG
jgi:hypothetical protein